MEHGGTDKSDELVGNYKDEAMVGFKILPSYLVNGENHK